MVLLTHESAGDVFRDLVAGAAHLRQVRQLSVQHPLKLQRQSTHDGVSPSHQVSNKETTS